jgi:hypothetical protein
LDQDEPHLLITRNGKGHAEPDQQQRLITTYFKLLDENNILPATICFYMRGVHLVVAGSSVLEPLRSLETKGVRLILCSTCLYYYQLTEQVQVGIVGGMADISKEASGWQGDSTKLPLGVKVSKQSYPARFQKQNSM